jgi:hypothetical protein
MLFSITPISSEKTLGLAAKAKLAQIGSRGSPPNGFTVVSFEFMPKLRDWALLLVGVLVVFGLLTSILLMQEYVHGTESETGGKRERVTKSANGERKEGQRDGFNELVDGIVVP